jgi:hypothetical protein
MIMTLDLSAILVAAMLNGVRLPFTVGHRDRKLVIGTGYNIRVFSPRDDALVIDNQSTDSLEIATSTETYHISPGGTATIVSDVLCEEDR